MQRQDKEYIHGQLGVEATRILLNTNLCWQIQEEDKSTVKIAMENVNNTLDIWQHHLNQSSANDGDIESDMIVIQHTMQPEVSAISNLWNNTNDSNLTCNDETEYVLLTDFVDWHLRETIIRRCHLND